MVAKTYTAQIVGLSADIICVETDITKGLHTFSIVGLGDKAIDQARDRLNSAIKNSGFKAPNKGNKKIVVSLAPAGLKKEGTTFDLAIALSLLSALGEITFDPKGKMFLGELSLSGDLRPIRGTLLILQKAKAKGFTEVYLPVGNAKEAGLIDGIKVYAVKNLKEIADFLNTKPTPPSAKNPKPEKVILKPVGKTQIKRETPETRTDFADIKSQETAKRGLEIAAAGGHNAAMSGPPGTGKTLLARAFTGILPELSIEEIIEVTGIHSVNGSGLITAPPFRAPHHTASYVSLVGGGAWPKPGEVTLAHRGILFLDEFPEFEKRVIEALRQPLEDKIIAVARAKQAVIFPANSILITAMNLCPCGRTGLVNSQCVCPPSALAKYERRISGPIVDRIDVWLSVNQVDPGKLSDDKNKSESSAVIRQRVEKARQIQKNRFQKAGLNLRTNSDMGPKEIKMFAQLDAKTTELLNDAARKMDLSARAYHRIIKLARTIADLENTEKIKEAHILEALQYRPRRNF